jgi:hypothetical protein
MAIRNVMLFSWGGGSYAEIAPSEYFPDVPGPIADSRFFFGRREVWLDLNQIVDGRGAFWTAVSNFVQLTSGEKTVAATYHPTGETPDMPFTDYEPGDYISVTSEDGSTTDTVRVISIAGKRDRETGRMVFTPTLETKNESYVDRNQRWLKRSQSGTMGGRSKTATASSPHVTGSNTRSTAVGPSFNTGDTLEVGKVSSPWTSEELVKVTRFECAATSTGTSASSFSVTVDGTPVFVAGLEAGETSSAGCLMGYELYIAPGQQVVAGVFSNGGHPGATMKLFVVPVNS